MILSVCEFSSLVRRHELLTRSNKSRFVVFGISGFSPSPAVESHLPIDHVRHVAPIAEELHQLFAGACHQSPPGFRLRILFQPPNFVPIENKIHLSKSALGSGPNRKTFRPEFDRFGILYERLPPHFDENLPKGERHRSRIVSLVSQANLRQC